MGRHDQVYIDKLFSSCCPCPDFLEITVAVEVFGKCFDDVHLAALSDRGIKKFHECFLEEANGRKRDKGAHDKRCYGIDVLGKDKEAGMMQQDYQGKGECNGQRDEPFEAKVNPLGPESR